MASLDESDDDQSKTKKNENDGNNDEKENERKRRAESKKPPPAASVATPAADTKPAVDDEKNVAVVADLEQGTSSTLSFILRQQAKLEQYELCHKKSVLDRKQMALTDEALAQDASLSEDMAFPTDMQRQDSSSSSFILRQKRKQEEERAAQKSNIKSNEDPEKKLEVEVTGDALVQDEASEDIAFPTELQRQGRTSTASRPGAYAQQGIGGSRETTAAESIPFGPSSVNHNTSSSFEREQVIVVDGSLAPSDGSLPQAREVDSTRSTQRRRKSTTMDDDDLTEDDEERELPTLAEAEPLDDLIRRRKRWTKKIIAAIVVAALFIVALSVGFTLFVEDTGSDILSHHHNHNDDDDVEARLQDVTSAHDIKLINNLLYASYHVLDFGLSVSKSCRKRKWGILELSCLGSAEGKTTIVVLDVLHQGIICERLSGKRNFIKCSVDEHDKRTSFSGIVLVACGTNSDRVLEENKSGALALNVAQTTSTAVHCKDPVETDAPLPGGLQQTTVKGDLFQWIGLGRFCHVVNTENHPLQLIHSHHLCEQGSQLRFPEQVSQQALQIVMQENNLEHLPEESFCVNWGECHAYQVCLEPGICNGAAQCDVGVNGVRVSDPQYTGWNTPNHVSCIFTNPSNSNNASSSLTHTHDMNEMWNLVDPNRVYIDNVLPVAIMDNLSPRPTPG